MKARCPDCGIPTIEDPDDEARPDEARCNRCYERGEFRRSVRDKLAERAVDLSRIGCSESMTNYLVEVAIALEKGQPLHVGTLNTLARDLVNVCAQDARITPEQAQDWLETEG